MNRLKNINWWNVILVILVLATVAMWVFGDNKPTARHLFLGILL